MTPPRLALLIALVLSGCSLVGGGSAEVAIRVTLPPSATGLDAEIAVDGRAVALASLPTTGDIVYYQEPASQSAGSTRFACSLAGNGASATVEQTVLLADDWRYTVACAAQATDPTEGCFGCGAAASADIDAALKLPAGTRLWLFTAGGPKDGSILY